MIMKSPEKTKNLVIAVTMTAVLALSGCSSVRISVDGLKENSTDTVTKELNDVFPEDILTEEALEGLLSEEELTVDFLTEDEKKVDEYLKSLKEAADPLYPENVPYGIIDWDEDTPVNEELYEFCRILPKGGDLHVHDDMELPFDEYYELITSYPGVSIELEDKDKYGYLYLDDAPDTAVLLSDALDEGELTEDELKSLLTLSDEDIPDGRWNTLNTLFRRKSGLTPDQDFMKKVYEKSFRNCCENNISLLELRTGFRNDEKWNRKICDNILKPYYKVKKDYPEFTVRLIATAGKRYSYEKEDTIEILENALKLSGEIKDESDPEDPKDFIIGLDLVNEEDDSRPLSEYADFLGSDEVKESGLKLFLHSGESLRMDNTSVPDALKLGSARLGHGFNLYRYPDLMDECRDNSIAVEVCPISNYRLGYVSDLRLHPGFSYIKNDIPVVIASDDGLFMTKDPLVNDYYGAILAWDLDLLTIKKLCCNNYIYSGLSMDETIKLMLDWNDGWAEFIETMNEQIKDAE